jgi:hypothetical protein
MLGSELGEGLGPELGQHLFMTWFQPMESGQAVVRQRYRMLLKMAIAPIAQSGPNRSNKLESKLS